MGKWVHRLSNKDIEAMVADCAECGPGVKLVPGSGRSPRCYNAHLANRREQKERARRNGKFVAFATRKNGTRVFRNRDGSTFSLSEEEYWAARLSFPQQCGICGGTTNRLDLDHCHWTGRIRGLLCMRCNTASGSFGDDPDLLRRAIAYLEAGVTPLPGATRRETGITP